MTASLVLLLCFFGVLGMAQVPPARLMSYRFSLAAIGNNCGFNSCTGMYQFKMNNTETTTTNPFTRCGKTTSTSWNQTTVGEIIGHNSYYRDFFSGEEHYSDGSGPVGTWVNFSPDRSSPAGTGCSAVASLAAYARENEIFPSQNIESSTIGEIQITTSLTYDAPPNNGCPSTINCQNTTSISLADGTAENVGGGCFLVSNVQWELADGDMIKYWGTVSYDRDSVVLSCMGRAGETCNAEPSFYQKYQNCAFTYSIAFNAVLPTTTSPSSTPSSGIIALFFMQLAFMLAWFP